jgi:FtsP/CotA-like multicopper oxidase with cupredoxin domain
MPIPPLARRHVLAGTGAAVTCFSLPAGLAAAADPGGFQLLRARTGSMPPSPDRAAAAASPIWGYEGAVPGPLLRVRAGDELRVRLVNALPGPTAIHWHGVRTPNLMDGVPSLTQAAVAPRATFDYSFRPPDAGTFWYHAPWFPVPTSEAEQTVQQRLYGALIVEEALPAAVDREHVLVFDDWPVAETAGAHRIRANATPAPDLAVRANERLRLRLINAASARVIALRLERHAINVMALDGQPAEPFRAQDSRLVLAPGNTADLFVDATLEPGAVAAILLADAPQETPLARLVYDHAPPLRPAPLGPPQALRANPLPTRLDFTHALKPDWPIEQAPRPSTWPQPARFSVKRGRTVMLALVNRQDSACAVHVHGHAFRLLDRLDDGWKPFWLTTVLVDARQTVRMAFLADNPGKWLIEWLRIDRPGSVEAGWFEVA